MLQERQHHDLSNPQEFTQMQMCQWPKWPAAQDLLLSEAPPGGHGYSVLERLEQHFFQKVEKYTGHAYVCPNVDSPSLRDRKGIIFFEI
jgi:hypothetical protein